MSDRCALCALSIADRVCYEVGFSIRFFFAVFSGSCLATSHEKPECTKDSGFFYASVNGSTRAVYTCIKNCFLRQCVTFFM